VSFRGCMLPFEFIREDCVIGLDRMSLGIEGCWPSTCVAFSTAHMWCAAREVRSQQVARLLPRLLSRFHSKPREPTLVVQGWCVCVGKAARAEPRWCVASWTARGGTRLDSNAHPLECKFTLEVASNTGPSYPCPPFFYCPTHRDSSETPRCLIVWSLKPT
jgi:hypothetical protein